MNQRELLQRTLDMLEGWLPDWRYYPDDPTAILISDIKDALEESDFATK